VSFCVMSFKIFFFFRGCILFRFVIRTILRYITSEHTNLLKHNIRFIISDKCVKTA
jgi:hypothetical protein